MNATAAIAPAGTELFGGVAWEKQAQEPVRSKEPWCVEKCSCGKSVGNYLRHYELVRCRCGKFYWALQPKRNGPLKLFPWPGPNLSAAEMAEKYPEES